MQHLLDLSAHAWLSVGMNRRLSAQYDQYQSPGSESGHCLRYADAIQAIEHAFSKNDISRVTYGWNTPVHWGRASGRTVGLEAVPLSH